MPWSSESKSVSLGWSDCSRDLAVRGVQQLQQRSRRVSVVFSSMCASVCVCVCRGGGGGGGGGVDGCLCVLCIVFRHSKAPFSLLLERRYVNLELYRYCSSCCCYHYCCCYHCYCCCFDDGGGDNDDDDTLPSVFSSRKNPNISDVVTPACLWYWL